MKPKGYILSESAERVVIITLESNNRKTGNMMQVWILARNVSPVDAVKLGKDSLICGTCPHRGDVGTGRKRSCYVNVGQAPNSVWKGYQRGIYPSLALSEYASTFAGRAVRLGAYGDPVYIPRAIVRELCAVTVRHTGYTHQWRKAGWLREFVMASCDSIADRVEAAAAGWRTFRVSAVNVAQPNEILCPASNERALTSCQRCGLCNGAGFAKSIYIPVHGSGAGNFVIL